MTDRTGEAVGAVRNTVDEAALQAYITTIIPSFATPLVLKQFKFGQSNPTFLVLDAKGSRYVVRKKPPGNLINKKQHAVEREYQVIHALGTKTDVPVPRVFGLCEDNSVIGTPFYVMEFLDGRVFTKNEMDTVDKSQKRVYYDAVVDTLARLHKVKPNEVGLSNYGPPRDFYLRQIKTLSAISNLQASVVDDKGVKVEDIRRMDEMIAWFKRNLVADESSIMHGDFKVDNMVFHPVAPRVVGLLDWELSTIGHPLADLANLLIYWYMPHEIVGTNGGGFRGAPRPLPVPEADDLIREYCARVGRPYPIPKFDFCIAFCFFKYAVISQGIAARIARKQASSGEAGVYLHLFKAFVDGALEYVDRGDLSVSAKL
ncbi:kinase-like domain-containing protein [Zopfochytrium polystomum]|nr:kinase-like domain-containing protein [Zopfochytrium polystomum]